MEVYFENNYKSIIDLEFLKHSYKNGKLQGASVLAKLLNIDENSPFKKEEFNKNIFKEFGIRRQIWNYITIFLKTNIMPVSNDFDVQEMMQVTTTLGGIPSIEEFYINYKNEKLQKRKKYNPQIPKEDHRQLFHWIICRDSEFSNFQRSSLSNNYTPCKLFRIASTSVTDYCYFRKLKVGIDLSEEYESDNDNKSESESEDEDEGEDESENVSEYEQVSVNQALSNIHLQLMEEE